MTGERGVAEKEQREQIVKQCSFFYSKLEVFLAKTFPLLAREEMAIAILMSLGFSTVKIAKKFRVTTGTIESIQRSLREKLKIESGIRLTTYLKQIIKSQLG